MRDWRSLISLHVRHALMLSCSDDVIINVTIVITLFSLVYLHGSCREPIGCITARNQYLYKSIGIQLQHPLFVASHQPMGARRGGGARVGTRPVGPFFFLGRGLFFLRRSFLFLGRGFFIFLGRGLLGLPPSPTYKIFCGCPCTPLTILTIQDHDTYMYDIHVRLHKANIIVIIIIIALSFVKQCVYNVSTMCLQCVYNVYKIFRYFDSMMTTMMSSCPHVTSCHLMSP